MNKKIKVPKKLNQRQNYLHEWWFGLPMFKIMLDSCASRLAKFWAGVRTKINWKHGVEVGVPGEWNLEQRWREYQSKRREKGNETQPMPLPWWYSQILLLSILYSPLLLFPLISCFPSLFLLISTHHNPSRFKNFKLCWASTNNFIYIFMHVMCINAKQTAQTDQHTFWVCY